MNTALTKLKVPFLLFCLIFTTIFIVPSEAVSAEYTDEEISEICLEIADIPLVTQIESAPPLVMMLLDDSGSMSWDVLCPETNGTFSGSTSVEQASSNWKSQWAGYNSIYYNPEVTYDPWETDYTDADSDTPLTDPTGTATRNLDSTFIRFRNASIPYAHYYIWSDSEDAPYLVSLSGSVTYYSLEVSSTTDDAATVRNITELDTASIPDDINILNYDEDLSGYDEQRQNFANWYTYSRTRQLVAKGSLGKVISSVSEVKLGIHSINGSVTEGVRTIDVDGEVDYTDYMLEKLYSSETNGSTPLRTGLEDVGQYYDADDKSDGGIGDSPFSSENDGGACQQAFVIVMTDGYYNGEDPGVGNADGDGNTDYDGDPYGDDYRNSLADVAMKYYENDLSDDLPDSIQPGTIDTATHQHMVTYTISFGLTGTLTYDESCPSDTTACPTWTDPDDGDDEKIDQLWHAAVNGRGDFLTAGDTEELTEALETLLTDIQDRSRTGASVSLSTQEVEDTTAIYQTYFDSLDWDGDLQAWSLIDISSMYWSAKVQLEAIDANDRQIITFNGSKGISFRYDSLSDTQKATLTSDQVDYIRGESSNEESESDDGTFRDRDGKLGDIVNSSPLLFNEMIYVGANDGMLHCFDADTGDEKFAYIPNLVFDNLPNYIDPEYTHNYYVDNTPYAATVDDTSYLIGTLGKGGRGIFGIDISDVSAIKESSIPDIWEYPGSGGDSDMGFSYSCVSIVYTNSTTTTEPLILFGNGYNSMNGSAVLYLLNLDGTVFQKIDTGTGSIETEKCNGLSSPTAIDINFDGRADYVYAGDLLGNLWKFDLTSEDSDDWCTTAYNDGTSNCTYDGSSNQPLFQAKSPDGTLQPITSKPDVMYHSDSDKAGYIVIFGTGRYLTYGDSTDYDVQSVYGIWDWADEWTASGVTSDENYYMGYFNSLVDDEDRTLSNIDGNSLFPSDSVLTLLQQTQTNEEDDVDYIQTSNNTISWFSPETWENLEGAEDYSGGTHIGWYFDLPEEGERVISDLQIIDGKVIFVSIIPSESICSAGGSSIAYILSASNGGQLSDAQFDTNGDGVVDENDEAASGVTLDDIYYAPAIIEDQMVLDKDTVLDIESETTGIYSWKLVD